MVAIHMLVKTVAITYGFGIMLAMRWQQLLEIVGDEPTFETLLLVAGEVTPYQVQRQLSDWVQADKVTQLKRGVYSLAPRFQAIRPHPFVIANRLVAGSYVSLQMALSYYGLIPEHVAVVTSVTTQRPGRWQNEFGRFVYRHVVPHLFYGMDYLPVTEEQFAYIATPEKALLDLIYLRPRGDSADYIHSLRLQNLDQLDQELLHQFAERSGKPKLRRAAEIITQIATLEVTEYEPL